MSQFSLSALWWYSGCHEHHAPLATLHNCLTTDGFWSGTDNIYFDFSHHMGSGCLVSRTPRIELTCPHRIHPRNQHCTHVYANRSRYNTSLVKSSRSHYRTPYFTTHWFWNCIFVYLFGSSFSQKSSLFQSSKLVMGSSNPWYAECAHRSLCSCEFYAWKK